MRSNIPKSAYDTKLSASVGSEKDKEKLQGNVGKLNELASTWRTESDAAKYDGKPNKLC